MKLNELIGKLPEEGNLEVRARPYFNHSVELKRAFSAQERARVLERVGLNIFFFPAKMITGVDFLSDSGTTTMTNEQWASLHIGDESYSSNRGYFELGWKIKEIFGEEFFNEQTVGRPNAYIFHQGRAAEDALFGMIGRLGNGLLIPSNGHFDTTQANMEVNKIKAVNLFSPELKGGGNSHFKGNVDIERFKDLLKGDRDKIPLVYLTITNNTGGGQPVSLANIREVSEISHENGIPLFFDACRFAENAWFIKEYENGYRNKGLEDIVKEMFSYVDGFTISFKKDGLVNMGGGLFLRDGGLFVKKYPNIPNKLVDHQVVTEGNPTYGGMSGRDIMSLCVGLRTVLKGGYLRHRIRQVQEFGEYMNKLGLPVLTPIGGHAVYLDMNKFFEGTNMEPGDFGGIAFTAVLLAAYGHRACELGYFTFGYYDKGRGREVQPEVNFVRYAVPRLRYEKEDLKAAAEATKILSDNKNDIPPVDVVYGRDLSLRHFKAKFKFRV